MAIRTPQRGRGRIPAPAADVREAPERIPVDIRSRRPFFLTNSQLTAAARRLASITVLVALDLGGLVLGLYAALVARELYYGGPVLWGLRATKENSANSPGLMSMRQRIATMRPSCRLTS